MTRRPGRRPGLLWGGMASPEKLTAACLGRVLARHVAAGTSAEFPVLLLETADELECLEERLRREARTARRARKQVRAALLQVAESVAFDMPPGVPDWHPEASQNDII